MADWQTLGIILYQPPDGKLFIYLKNRWLNPVLFLFLILNNRKEVDQLAYFRWISSLFVGFWTAWWISIWLLSHLIFIFPIRVLFCHTYQSRKYHGYFLPFDQHQSKHRHLFSRRLFLGLSDRSIWGYHYARHADSRLSVRKRRDLPKNNLPKEIILFQFLWAIQKQTIFRNFPTTIKSSGTLRWPPLFSE